MQCYNGLMIGMLAAIVIVFCLVTVSEWLWRRRKIDPEYTRKFVHMTVGTFVAMWPFFLSRWQIVGLSAAFLLVVAMSQWLHVFQAIHSVQRPTWGEACFAIAVGLLAILTTNNWVYVAALLHMSVADGLAAIVGIKLGRTNRYYIVGYAKSLAGTAAFAAASLIILIVCAYYAPIAPGPWLLLATAGATLLENFAIRGLDNLLVPVYIASVLSFVR